MSENNEDKDLDLVDFLIKDMGEKRVSAADVTKRTGLSASQVSKILSRESPAGQRALECFAQALNLPYEFLYQLAKKRSRPQANEARRQELMHLNDMMNDKNQDDLIAYARMRFQQQEREDKNKKNGKSNRPSNDL